MKAEETRFVRKGVIYVGTVSVRDQWISQARFDREFGSSGLDHDFGMFWGPRADQRVSLRVPAGGDAGVLYVYDPLWNEYQVLGRDVAVRDVDDAFRQVTITFGYRELPVTVLGEAVNDLAVRPEMAPMFEMSVGPRTIDDLGLSL